MDITKDYIHELITKKPLWLFITLTFRKLLPIQMEMRAINFYLHCLNRKVFNRRYNKLGLFLSGYAVRESNRTDSLYHWHIVFHQHFNIRKSSIMNIEAINDRCIKMVHLLGDQYWIDLVWNPQKLAGYITKDNWTIDDIYFIGMNGLIGV